MYLKSKLEFFLTSYLVFVLENNYSYHVREFFPKSFTKGLPNFVLLVEREELEKMQQL